jgi:hypothetical protein
MPDGGKLPIDDLVSVFETWQVRRKEEAEGFHLRGFRGFVELMNYETRRAISLTGKQDPDFWSAVAEIATNAQTLTTAGAKLRADHRDMTNY